jgi:hypothetical protein
VMISLKGLNSANRLGQQGARSGSRTSSRGIGFKSARSLTGSIGNRMPRQAKGGILLLSCRRLFFDFVAGCWLFGPARVVIST